MSRNLVAHALKSASASTTNLEPQPPLYGDVEAYSENILGPVQFKLSELKVAGTNQTPAAPHNSPYIIAADETFTVSVKVEFNKSPLSSLLMCLGTKIDIDFAFEGFGKRAVDIDLEAQVMTQKGQYEYLITFTSQPNQVGLTPGLYQIAAVAAIGPVVGSECTTPVLGYGYIERVLLEVYPASENS